MTAEQVCRLCLSSEGLILPIFNGVVAEKFSVPLPVKIMSCLSIEISSDDVLPTLICYRCLYKVDRFHEFKAACGKVATILQECVTSDSNLIVAEKDNKEEIFNPIEYCTTTHDAPVHASSVSNSPRAIEESIEAINKGGMSEMNDHSSAESLEVPAFKYDEYVEPCGIRNASDTSSPKSGILALVTATNTNANSSSHEEIIFSTVTNVNAKSAYQLSLEDEELPVAIVNDGGISFPSNGLISCGVGNEDTAGSPSKEVVSLPTVVTEGTSSSQSNKKSHGVENEETTNTSRNDTVSCEVVNEKDQCERTRTRGSFKKHEKINGNKSEPTKDKVVTVFSCKNCSRTYKTQRSLCRHEKFYCRFFPKETKKKFKAEGLKENTAGISVEQCNKKATVLSVPKTVVQLPVCCKFCSTSFTVKRRRIHHEKYVCFLNPNKERRRKQYFTKICNESFKHSRALKMDHNQSNIGTHKLQCRFCPKMYSKEPYLEKHESIHLGNKPYKCRVCNKAFSDSSNCKNHEKIHTNVRPFVCLICGKAFIFRKVLRNHEFLHTGIRDVKCELCPKSFADKSNLRSHLHHVHSTLRNHLCPRCGRSFKTNSALKKHSRVHLREKPYSVPKHKRKHSEIVKESDPSTNKD